MRKIILFMMVSVDGFFEGINHDLSWHNVDQEFNEFALSQLKEVDTLLFGRKTYQLMEEFWPSKEALEGDPEVAKLMNNMPKVVVSKSLKKANETENWKNVTLLNNVIDVSKFKNQNGKDILLLGSNNLSVALLNEGLLDEVRLMINPVIIGSGSQVFSEINTKMNLILEKSRVFKSGNTLLIYKV